MAQVPTPPSSREVSVEPVKIAKYVDEDKVLELDNLLEHYLHLIDTYQTLRNRLGKNLSSGFFSLTHANYCSPSRRFGEDFYDERMKATRTLDITSQELQNLQGKTKQSLEEKIEFSVKYKPVLPKDEDKVTTQEPDKTSSESGSAIANHEDNLPDSAAKTSPNSSKDRDSNEKPAEDIQPRKPKRFRSDDPISWYGILVPPSLKTAQKAFTESVSSDIPQLVSIMVEIKKTEGLVNRLRTELAAA